MGRRNYLVEGLSGTGKTTVADELQRRGHQVVHGDRELAYQGDPSTGEPTVDGGHENHLWDVDTVRALAADRSVAATFFCDGISRSRTCRRAAWSSTPPHRSSASSTRSSVDATRT